MSAAPTKPTPRPTCAGCPVLLTRVGCGWLSSGTPCKHPVERRRAETGEKRDVQP